MLKGNKVRRTESGADAHVAAQAAAGGPGWREAVGMEPGRGIWVHREDRVAGCVRVGVAIRTGMLTERRGAPLTAVPSFSPWGLPGLSLC